MSKQDTLPLTMFGLDVQAASQEGSGCTDFPAQWKTAQLGDVATAFTSGGTPSTTRPELWDGSIPWTTSAPIDEQATELDRAQRYITEQALTASATHLVPQGSLLVGSRVGVGKAVVNCLDIAISQDLTGVLLDQQRALSEFAAYQFKTRRVQDFLDGRKRGTTIKGISRFDLQAVVLHLPPIAEQHAIVSALRTVQDAIQARRREVELERERKAALMQHLFTHGTRGEPTKLTEIGEMPESWQVVRIGDMATLQRGFDLPENARTPGPYPVMGGNGASGFHSEWGAKGPGVFVGRSGAGGVGKVNWTDTDYWPLNTALWVSDFHGNNPRFVYYRLLSLSLRKYAEGASVPTLNRNLVHPLPVGLPPLAEQTVIASTLAACDDFIAKLEGETALLDEVFRALLEELMTGRLSALPLVEAEAGVPA